MVVKLLLYIFVTQLTSEAIWNQKSDLVQTELFNLV